MYIPNCVREKVCETRVRFDKGNRSGRGQCRPCGLTCAYCSCSSMKKLLREWQTSKQVSELSNGRNITFLAFLAFDKYVPPLHNGHLELLEHRISHRSSYVAAGCTRMLPRTDQHIRSDVDCALTEQLTAIRIKNLGIKEQSPRSCKEEYARGHI